MSLMDLLEDIIDVVVVCSSVVRLMSQCFEKFQVCIDGESVEYNRNKKKCYFGICSESTKSLVVTPEQERFLLLICIGNCLLYSRFDNTISKYHIRHQSNICISNCRSICGAMEIFTSQFLGCLFIFLWKISLF